VESVSILESTQYKLEVMYKRFEDRWAGGKRKIYRGSGLFRDFMIQHLYVPTRTVIFYARADLEILKDLLKDLIGLGDNWRVGWGAVRKFVIEEIEEGWSIVADGRAMRPIPVRFFEKLRRCCPFGVEASILGFLQCRGVCSAIHKSGTQR